MTVKNTSNYTDYRLINSDMVQHQQHSSALKSVFIDYHLQKRVITLQCCERMLTNETAVFRSVLQVSDQQ